MRGLEARYANALYELSLESGDPGAFAEQAVFLRGFLEDGDCRRIFNHPHVPASDKHKLLTDAFSGRVHSDLLGFLRLAVDKNREAFIIPALNLFIETHKRGGNKTTARVASASALSESQISALKTILEKKLNKETELIINIDPSLIGGLHIHADGFFFDFTLKKRIKDIISDMKRETPNHGGHSHGFTA